MWCNLSGAVYVVKLFSAPMTPGLKSEGAERWPERRRGDARMNMATHALGTTRVVASGDAGSGRSDVDLYDPVHTITQKKRSSRQIIQHCFHHGGRVALMPGLVLVHLAGTADRCLLPPMVRGMAGHPTKMHCWTPFVS